MNLQEVRDAYSKNEKLEYLFFWGHSKPNDETINACCFSQWYPVEFKVDDFTYANAEQFMMASKAKLFNDEEIFEQIVNTQDPKTVKALGRKVRGFEDSIWKERRFEIVKRGNLHKFTQNKKLKEFLLSTENKIIVEASPYDRIWGIGMEKNNKNIENPLKWGGQNLLGFALMAVREDIKNFSL